MTTKVQTVNRLHHEAMEYSDLSFVARLHGNREEYLRFTRLALLKEAAAADLMVDEDVEPTRSVLHRSAATLAWRCEEYGWAKKLIYRALLGNPPSFVERELNDLLGTVSLAIEGQHLQRHEIQMSLAGNAVGNGLISVRDLLTRANAIPKLLQLSVKSRMRLLGDYSEDELSSVGMVSPLISGIAPGSFILTFRFAGGQQFARHGFEQFDKTVMPFFENIRLLEKGYQSDLLDNIGDPKDYRAFLKAARPLAPDGDRISSVKFQADSGTSLELVSLSRTRASFSDIPLPPLPDEEVVFTATEHEVCKSGILSVADALEQTECVLVTDNGNKWELEGPEDTMDEIVRTFFKRKVEVRGKRMRKTNLVNRIRLSTVDDVGIAADKEQPTT